MTAVLSAIRRVLVGTGSTAFTVVGALLIGFGVPLLWIFLGSQFYGKTGAVNGPVAAFIGTGHPRLVLRAVADRLVGARAPPAPPDRPASAPERA